MVTGGITAEEFETVKPYIKKTNIDTFMAIGIMGIVLGIVLTILALSNIGLGQNLAAYWGLLISCLLLVAWCLTARAGKIGSAAIPFVALAVGLLYGVYLGCANDQSLPAVTFMVLIIALPLLVVDRPYRVVGLIVAGVLVMVFCTLVFKTDPHIQMLDIVDAICFGCISIFANAVLTRTQIVEALHRAQAEQKLGVDALTGLKNSHAYYDIVNKLEQRVANGEASEYAAVVADVNDLKGANDNFGHAAGDELIRSAGQLLCDAFPHSPVMRTGGDEFVVVLTGSDYGRRHEALAWIEQEMKTRRFDCEGIARPISVACGLGEYDATREMHWEDVFHDADAAMYEKKARMKAEQGLGAVR